MGIFSKDSKIGWIATRMDDIKKIAMSIIFVGGLGYAAIDVVEDKFITRLEASNYALKANVSKLDFELARMQIVVLQNELFNARRVGIVEDDKPYYRSLSKRLFLLKIKLAILDASKEDYIVPAWLR